MEAELQQPREAAPIAWLRTCLMRIRPLVELIRRLVMGCGDSPKFKRLARDLEAGAHESVLDLGCNTATLLKFVQPKRYVGIDGRPRSIEFARRRHSRPGWTFVEGDFMRRSLEEWRGSDVVVCSALLHHLPDEEVGELIRRVFTEVGAKRICVAEGTARGPFQRLLNFLDDGSPDRPREDLVALVGTDYAVEQTWQFRTPLRTYDFFGLTIEPRTEPGSG
jgi:SAM-dependent methyltransferase